MSEPSTFSNSSAFPPSFAAGDAIQLAVPVRRRRLAHAIGDLGDLQHRGDTRAFTAQLALAVEIRNEIAERFSGHARDRKTAVYPTQIPRRQLEAPFSVLPAELIMKRTPPICRGNSSRVCFYRPGLEPHWPHGDRLGCIRQALPARRAALVEILKTHPRFTPDFADAMPKDVPADQKDRWLFMRPPSGPMSPAPSPATTSPSTIAPSGITSTSPFSSTMPQSKPSILTTTSTITKRPSRRR